MKRALMLATAALVMAAMVVAMAMPALAAKPSFLAITRSHPLNYAMVLTSDLVPFAALVVPASTLEVARSC